MVNINQTYVSFISSQQMQSPKNIHLVPTLCGPFDHQFARKFRGKHSHSGSVQHLKLAKPPHPLASDRRGQTASLPNILPKLREIEKLAKSERKKPPKANKYVDGVSELQLYLAKKLVNNLTTQQIVSRIVQNNSTGFENRKVVTDNYLRMTVNPPENTPLHQIDTSSLQNHTTEQRFARTEYSPNKKWVSDKEFVQKFDKFIIKKHDQETNQDKEGEETPVLSEAEAVRQIRSDKETITRIAKEMIAEQNKDEDQEEVRLPNGRFSSLEGSSVDEPRGIDWIIRECGQFQKKFHVKSNKIKRKKLN